MKNIYAIVLMMLLTSLIALSPLTLMIKPSNALPGPRIYLEPSDTTFYSNVTSVGQKFNVTVWVQNATSIGGAQVYLEFNDDIVNVTRWFEPKNDPEYIFYSRGTSALPTPPDPGYVHVSSGVGYVQTSVSLFPPDAPYFTGDGKICIYEFTIIAAPPEDGTLTCTLHINTVDTYLLDGEGVEVPNVTKEDGTYSFIYAPPLPAVAHIWLEASPNTYEAIKPRPFNVSIIIQNVSELDGLIGVQFEVHYNSTYLEATEIMQGDFLNDPIWAPFGTFASYYVEDGRVVYGEIILPDDAGEWAPPFPSGNGTVATITFLPLLHESANFNITVDPLYGEDFFLSKDGEWMPYLASKGCSYTYNARLLIPTLSVDPDEYISSHLGENFDINIAITNLDEEWDLVHVEFKLEYNATFINAINVTEGDFMAQFGETTLEYEEGTGYVKVNITLTPDGAFPSGDGIIATITFNVTSRPPAVSNLLLEETLLLDPDGYDVLHESSHGYYTMHEVLVHEIIVSDTLTFYVITVSNASITPVPMVFDVAHRMLYFNVTGWGTPAFIEITIPNDLIQDESDNWLVFVGGYRIFPSITAINETHTLLTFTYNFTNEPVHIIGTWAVPEIPSSAMPILFLLATLISLGLTSVVYKKHKGLKPF
jgi:hypothetical protein